MAKIVPIRYMPDEDCWWSANPGAVRHMKQLAPLSRGSYGSVGSVRQFTITGTDYLYGKMFRKTSGSTRFLVFRKSDIDEYTYTGSMTNQGTGYSASTTGWSATGFGDAIVACNYLDATVISTGSTFSSIGSGCPKARLVAANDNFVMLADYDDGSNQYADGWWCSALGSATSWTASLSTQAANGRILDTSGPIRALISYKDVFVAFKDNSIHIFEYVGPPYIWSVRTISNSIGANGPRAVAELRGMLYFAHSSGLYAFDGAQITSIGDVVENTFLLLAGEVNRKVMVTPDTPTLNPEHTSLSKAQLTVDDVENIVWFSLPYFASTEGTYTNYSYAYSFGYNVTSRKWGRIDSGKYYNTTRPVFIDARHADVKSFLQVGNSDYARMLKLQTNLSTSGLFVHMYPYASTQTYESMGGGSFTTGPIGEHGTTLRAARVWWHTGWDSAPGGTMVDAVTANSCKNSGNVGLETTVNATLNTTLDCYDVTAAGGQFVSFGVTTKTSLACEIYGIGVDLIPAGQQ